MFVFIYQFISSSFFGIYFRFYSTFIVVADGPRAQWTDSYVFFFLFNKKKHSTENSQKMT